MHNPIMAVLALLLVCSCNGGDDTNKHQVVGGSAGFANYAGNGGDEDGKSGSGAGVSGKLAGSSGSQAGVSGGQAETGGVSVQTQFKEVKSPTEYETSPNVSSSDAAALAAGNTRFALDMYHALRLKYLGGFFYSPYSISVALAMTYAGATNNTKTEMANTLHFTLADAKLHPAYNAENIALNSRGKGALASDGKGFRLNIANSIWGQTGYSFLSPFLNTLARNYEAGLRLVDFISAPEVSRVTINDWVEEKTEDRIQDLLPQGSIDDLTRLVLVNAVYFNAAWLNPFAKATTRDGTFYTLGGQTVKVPIMMQTDDFSYYDGQDCKAIELPYDGRELSMVVIVPDSGAFSAVEASLSPEKISKIIAGLTSEVIALSMPKWTFKPDGISLVSILEGLGIHDAFIFGTADFSGMAGNLEPLYISDVVHKAFVAVDENGTEAAAATAVVVGTKGIAPTPVPFDIDRPFIYLIRDIQTNTILFIGRMTDPSMTK